MTMGQATRTEAAHCRLLTTAEACKAVRRADGHLKVRAILSQRPFTQYCMNLKMAGRFTLYAVCNIGPEMKKEKNL